MLTLLLMTLVYGHFTIYGDSPPSFPPRQHLTLCTVCIMLQNGRSYCTMTNLSVLNTSKNGFLKNSSSLLNRLIIYKC